MKEEFLKHVESHVMTIKQDDGVFRSILFRKKDRSDRWFQITTWDGHLCICGDMGTYVFKRNHDMFDFFRGEHINRGYWSEKLEAGEYETFSSDKARQALNTEFENWVEGTNFDDYQISKEREALDSIDTDDEYEFIGAIRDWLPNKDGVQLNDFWEHNLKEYTYHFTWCCYAIVWAIQQYDLSKTEVAA